jgi:hypothetical protein
VHYSDLKLKIEKKKRARGRNAICNPSTVAIMPTAVETISLPVEAAPPNLVPTALFAATRPA